MANIKLAVVAMLVILLQASTLCAMAQHHDSGTPGVMTWNGYQRGEDGGPSECDGRYHSDRDMVAALSTRWYEGGRRCERMIHITGTQNGRTVEAKVVDECDSKQGCKDNIVVTSLAVWKALGLDVNVSEALVAWSDA